MAKVKDPLSDGYAPAPHDATLATTAVQPPFPRFLLHLFLAFLSSVLLAIHKKDFYYSNELSARLLIHS